MDDVPHLSDRDLEQALGERARQWARRVRRTGWALALAGAAIGAGLFAVLR